MTWASGSYNVIRTLSNFEIEGLEATPPPAPHDGPNVLFISIDDLNDWVSYLGGHPKAITPNIDRLVANGVAFTNAQCSAPYCGPSRASIISGLLPVTSGCYEQKDSMRNNPNGVTVTTLPEYFRTYGYNTYRSGKIDHGHDPVDLISWGENFPSDTVHRPDVNKPPGGAGTWAVAELEGVTDSEMDDGQCADWAIEVLGRTHTKPFFLGVGMYKPHLPFIVPKKYFDMYREPLLTEPLVLPTINLDDWDDIPARADAITDVGNQRNNYAQYFNTEAKLELRTRAYLACVTFADAQVGRVLDALEASPYADNTVIVLWSDHGWHLGEKVRAAKRSLWEEVGRVPLIFSGPGIQQNIQKSSPVSLVDVYPTLVSLVGLPANPQNDGRDISPILANAELEWTEPVITNCTSADNYAVRDQRWRYIRYDNGSEELYDHNTDPLEWTNLASDPQYNILKEQMAQFIPGEIPVVPDPALGDTANSDMILATYFEEGTGNTTSNIIQDNFHGILNGTPTWTTGPVDGALTFDGTDDYVDFGNLPVASQFTAAFWIKPDDVTTDFQGILGKWANGINSFRVLIGPTDGSIRFNMTPSSGGANQALDTEADVLTAGEWTHVIVNYDGVGMRIYINGSLAATSDALNLTLENQDTPLHFGQVNGSFFGGSVDSLQVFDRALTSTEITAIAVADYQHYARTVAEDYPDLPLKGQLEDGDGDGLSNFVEYALGLPLNSQQDGMLPIGTSVANNTLTYSFPRAESTVRYELLASSTLSDWDTAEVIWDSSTNPADLVAPGQTQSLDIQMGSEDKRFYRLRITE
jgi:arylsulfatase A-like enzyme